MNDDAECELPDSEKFAEQNQEESKLEIFAVQESSTYTSLKENKEPEHVYQSLQTLQSLDLALKIYHLLETSDNVGLFAFGS